MRKILKKWKLYEKECLTEAAATTIRDISTALDGIRAYFVEGKLPFRQASSMGKVFGISIDRLNELLEDQSHFSLFIINDLGISEEVINIILATKDLPEFIIQSAITPDANRETLGILSMFDLDDLYLDFLNDEIEPEFFDYVREKIQSLLIIRTDKFNMAEIFKKWFKQRFNHDLRFTRQ